MKKLVQALGLSVVLASPVFAASSAAAPVVGGYQTIETNLADVIGAAHFAVFTLNQEEGSPIYHLEKILSAESQIVAGVNYRLKLLVSSEQGEQIKQVVVFHQAWTKTWALVSVSDI